MLEPCEGKLSCTVLRGESGSNTADLLDQVIENKQKFISQVMTGKSPVRSCEDIDETALSYAEVKALATGNPYIREKMELDVQVSKLRLLKAGHDSQRYRLEDAIVQHYPAQIAALKGQAEGYRADIRLHEQNRPQEKSMFSMVVGNVVYTDRKDAGAALLNTCRRMDHPGEAIEIGEYRGFKLSTSYNIFLNKISVQLKGSLSHEVEIGQDTLGNLRRLDNALDAMPEKLDAALQKLDSVRRQLENAKIEVEKPFPKEKEFAEKTARLNELDALLNMDRKQEPLVLEEGIVEFGSRIGKYGKLGFRNDGIIGNAGSDIKAGACIASVEIGDLSSQAEQVHSSLPATPHPIPDNYISEVLRTGGGRRDSRSRIYAAYSHDSTPEEMVTFLKQEYGMIGKGFYFDGQPVSAWFDDKGMRIAYGTSAKSDSAMAFTWEEIEKHIRGLLENGTYMDADGASFVDKYELGHAASTTSSFIREAVNLNNELIIDGTAGRMEFHKVKEMLWGDGGIDHVMGQIDRIVEKLDQNGIRLQGRMASTLEEVRRELSRLKSSRIEFPLSQKLLDIKEESFITQDEFILRTGAGCTQDRSFRIYDYFKDGEAGKNKLGSIDFLKNEMNADSILPAMMGGEHIFWSSQSSAFVLDENSNGIYTKELLSWDMLENSISRMVKDGSYLSKDSLAAYQQYQQDLQETGKKMECRDSIENLIKEQYMGGRTPRGAARKIVEKYGWECVKDVLASSVMCQSGYECFSKDNREWAAGIVLSDKPAREEFVINTHPSYVETFINQARRYHFKCRQKQDSMQVVNAGGAKTEGKTAKQHERISIKKKIAQMREKPTSQVMIQMQPASKSRKKEACL